MELNGIKSGFRKKVNFLNISKWGPNKFREVGKTPKINKQGGV